MATITLNGDSTGYGATSGSESFVLNGFDNTLLLAGANDSITLAGGGNDIMNLNATGFTGQVTDMIDLGQGATDTIAASYALQNATIGVANGYGETTLSITNHGGVTSLDLGNLGDIVNRSGLALNDIIALNGDATNTVAFTNGSGAEISIGAASDGLSNYASSVALFGNYNTLVGGDERFTVTDLSGLNVITLGNGANTLTLQGDQNAITLGSGNNTLTLNGRFDTLSAGTGNNLVNQLQGGLNAHFGAGGAGHSDSITLAGALNLIHGGDENFTISNPAGNALIDVGNGNNVIHLGSGSITLGTSTANTATNTIATTRGGSTVTLNGGANQVSLGDRQFGYDRVVLNGTHLGTALTANGSFDAITFTADANAAITETAGNEGMTLILVGDATGGIGDITVTGLAQDNLAHLDLVNLGTYTITADNTPAGGLTLHFTHGSIDLIGEQAISNHLITG